MARLGEYILTNSTEWQEVKDKAYAVNQWFIPEFSTHSSNIIAQEFLNERKLTEWAGYYHIDENIDAKEIGIVMAGNIPLVGFHDFLSVFISGHKQKIKLSSKDDVLFKRCKKYGIF